MLSGVTSTRATPASIMPRCDAVRGERSMIRPFAYGPARTSPMQTTVVQVRDQRHGAQRQRRARGVVRDRARIGAPSAIRPAAMRSTGHADALVANGWRGGQIDAGHRGGAGGRGATVPSAPAGAEAEHAATSVARRARQRPSRSMHPEPAGARRIRPHRGQVTRRPWRAVGPDIDSGSLGDPVTFAATASETCFDALFTPS